MATKQQVASAIDEKGSTLKVRRKPVGLAFRRRSGTDAVTPGSGNNPPATQGRYEPGFVMLFYSAAFVDFFNVSEFPITSAAGNAETLPRAEIRARRITRTTLDGTPRTVDYAASDRVDGGESPARKTTHPAIIQTQVGGRNRKVHVAFPRYFTVPMMAQALGTMLKNASPDRRPQTFRTRSGRSYPIPYGAPVGSPMAGFRSGAWLVTTVPAGDIVLDAVVSSAGDLDRGDNQTQATANP